MPSNVIARYCNCPSGYHLEGCLLQHRLKIKEVICKRAGVINYVPDEVADEIDRLCELGGTVEEALDASIYQEAVTGDYTPTVTINRTGYSVTHNSDSGRRTYACTDDAALGALILHLTRNRSSGVAR